MTASAPRVSVIVPTYIRRDYLFEALESIFAQTYTDFEVIVGNDGGRAHIDPVKARYIDKRIVWVDHPVRKGVLANTLDGFARARGTYLATLHDDDRWAPEMLATLVPRLEVDPSVTVAFCDHFIIDRDGHVNPARSDALSAAWGRDRLAPGVHRPFRRLACIDGTIPMQCAAVFRRDALDVAGFPSGAGTKYDRWLSYEVARGDAGAYYEPARLSYYRSHPGSQTHNGRLENALAGIYVFRRFLEEPGLTDLPRAPLRAALADEHYGAAVALIRDGQSRRARRHLAQTLKLRPRPRAGSAVIASLMPRAVVERLVDVNEREGVEPTGACA